MSTVLVGLDIGFGNTKIAHQIGEPGPVQLHRFASGACPLDVLPVAIDGSRNLCGGGGCWCTVRTGWPASTRTT